MKKILFYRGKRISRIGFFGLGKSNLALFEYLKKGYGGISFTLRSDKEVSVPDGFCRSFSGAEARLNIDEDLLFFAPSVRRDDKEFLKAEKRGVIFSSDVEFFFESKSLPVIAVTGTDGKSTTASLVSLIMTEAKGAPFPASANIGLPMTLLLERDDVCGTVAELSSFQLMNVAPISRRALITNISENHLDWHTSMQEYALAKENALKNAEERVFNLDCSYGVALSKKYPAYAVYSSKMSYGEMRDITSAGHYFSLEKGKILLSGEVIGNECPVRLPGEYNLSNFLAALALTYGLAPTERIMEAAKKFTGLDHRITQIGEWDGISFYDSSIDSTPKRTLTTLSAIAAPTVLILGGRGKSLSYEPLAALPKNVRAVVICGENRNEIYAALKGTVEDASLSDSFDDAVLTAIKKARRGDTVLLSPASTSFDSFCGYADRGRRFCELIKKYYAER